jgi:sarcosine oxidase subunit gamma
MAERQTARNPQSAGQRTGLEPPVSVELLEPRSKLHVQSWSPSAVPKGLPATVGMAHHDRFRALCVGPTEWLIVGGPTSRLLAEAIGTTGLCGDFTAIDVTEGLQTLELRGRASRDLLAAGCGLDLHENRFFAGQCARTRFAGLPVIIDCCGDPDRFQLYVSRSYVSWLTAWLEDALK